jgi:hypothetical protein
MLRHQPLHRIVASPLRAFGTNERLLQKRPTYVHDACALPPRLIAHGHANARKLRLHDERDIKYCLHTMPRINQVLCIFPLAEPAEEAIVRRSEDNPSHAKEVRAEPFLLHGDLIDMAIIP